MYWSVANVPTTPDPDTKNLLIGPYPQYSWDFPEEIPEKFRNFPRKRSHCLSERFLEFPSRVLLGSPKPYKTRHLRLPEHFQNYLPPSTAGGASFFRSGSGEGLSEPVVEFPAVLGVFLIDGPQWAVVQGMSKGENGPLRHSEKQPIEAGKRPIEEGKRPLRLTQWARRDRLMSLGKNCRETIFISLGTRRIGASPEKPDLVNFRGPD